LIFDDKYCIIISYFALYNGGHMKKDQILGRLILVLYNVCMAMMGLHAIIAVGDLFLGQWLSVAFNTCFALVWFSFARHNLREYFALSHDE